MQHYLSKFQTLTLFFVGLLLVIMNMDSMWSQSSDMALHYSVIFRIFEHWVLVGVDDPSLGLMNFYPRMSYIFAVIAGILFNSPFLGMQLIALISLAVVWGAFIWILNTLPLRIAYISSIGLIGLLAINWAYLHFEVHGAELVVNFFFSQIVAQATAILAIAIAIFLEIKKQGNYVISVFFIVSIFMVTGMHLVPALELLGVFFGIVLINNYLLFNQPSSQRIKMLLWYLFTTIAALAVVFLSPSFTTMVTNAAHNGGLTLLHVSTPLELILLCFLVLILSGALLIIWFKFKDNENEGYIALKYLGLYGGAIAALCLAQIICLNFGYGSEYATKKYAYGLFSYLFISIPVLAGFFLNKIPSSLAFNNFLENNSLRWFVVIFIFVGVFFFSIQGISRLDTSDVVALERQLIALRDVALPMKSAKSNVVIDLPNMPPSINLMFSLAITKTPWIMAVTDLLFKNKLMDLNKYNVILTPVDSKKYYKEVCKLSSSTGTIALLNADCVEKELVKASNVVNLGNVRVSTQPELFAMYFLQSGWSTIESDFVWSEGGESHLLLQLKPGFSGLVSLDVAAFLPNADFTQTLSIYLNNKFFSTFEFTQNKDRRELNIPIENFSGEILDMKLIIKNPISPKAAGVSSDLRNLGVALYGLKIQER